MFFRVIKEKLWKSKTSQQDVPQWEKEFELIQPRRHFLVSEYTEMSKVVLWWYLGLVFFCSGSIRFCYFFRGGFPPGTVVCFNQQLSGVACGRLQAIDAVQASGAQTTIRDWGLDKHSESDYSLERGYQCK